MLNPFSGRKTSLRTSPTWIEVRRALEMPDNMAGRRALAPLFARDFRAGRLVSALLDLLAIRNQEKKSGGPRGAHCRQKALLI